MPEIDWSLLGQPADVFGHFQQGYNTAKTAREGEYQKSVLSAFAKNPTDPNIQSALATTSPAFALQLGESRIKKADTIAEKQRIGGIISSAGGDYAQAGRAALNSGELDLAETLSKLDDGHRKQMGEMYKAAAPLAYQAMKLPYEQRKAFIANAAPQLKAAGWDDAHLNSFDPSDQALTSLVQTNMTLEQAMARDKVDYKEVLPGARLVPFDSTGRPMTHDAGQSGGAPTAQPGNMHSYQDSGYTTLETPLEQQYGLPPGLMSRIRTQGERSNADQVSSAGARTVYQITPPTRQLFLNKYGIDAYSSPENAARVAALHLKESIDRGEDPVRGYIGGPNQSHWGPQTAAYAARVGPVASVGGHTADPAAIRAHAQDAIAHGADPAQVAARARALGVEL